MKYTKSNLLNNNFLEEEINLHLDFIISKTNLHTGFINIHTRRGERPVNDYSRIAFTLYSLSRITYLQEKNKLKNVKNIAREEIIRIVNINLFKLQSQNNNIKIYSYLYLAKAYINLNLNEAEIVNLFKKLDLRDLFSHPLSISLYITTFEKSKYMREDLFLTSVYNDCLKSSDFILHSNFSKKYYPLHFAELCMAKDIPNFLYRSGHNFIINNLEKYLNGNYASSGYAKMLEYFAFIEDFANFEKFTEKINTRKHTNFEYFEIANPQNFKYIFTEGTETQHINLDINTHIIQALLNFYEKNI